MAKQNDFNSYDDYAEDFDTSLPENRDNRWELDFNTDLDEFRYSWRNRITADGMEFILSYMRMILNKTNALTNFQDSHIEQMGKNYMRPLSKQLLVNCRKWSIDPSERLSITSQLCNLTLAHLRRAYKDGERQYRKGAYNVNLDDDNEFTHQSGGGMLDFLKSKANKKRPQITPQDDFNEDF